MIKIGYYRKKKKTKQYRIGSVSLMMELLNPMIIILMVVSKLTILYLQVHILIIHHVFANLHRYHSIPHPIMMIVLSYTMKILGLDVSYDNSSSGKIIYVIKKCVENFKILIMLLNSYRQTKHYCYTCDGCASNSIIL